MITFATFFIDSADSARETIAKENILLKNRNQYMQMIDMLFRSAAIYHPGCKKVILTDKTTDLSQVASDVIIYRVDIDAETVMLSRLIAQLAYAKNEDAAADLVFLDSDMLINGSLSSLFAENFQVALTYRFHDKMPINGGAIFLSKHQKQGAIDFLTYVLDIYREKYADRSTWWGDQYALLDAIDADLFAKDISEYESFQTIRSNGFETLLVPCSVYNFSPDYELTAIASKLEQPAIIHFKGRRKKLIPFYWQAYLASQEKSVPASGAIALKGKTALQFRIFEAWCRRQFPAVFSTARDIRKAMGVKPSRPNKNL